MRRIQLLSLLVLCTLTLLAAGCGSDDEPSSAESPAAVTETPAEAEDTEDSGGSAGDCKEFEEAATKVGQQFATALSGTGGDADVQEAARLFDELTSRAPSEIKDDFQVINDAFSKLADALEGVDLSGGQAPDQATLQRLQKISSEIDQARLSQASANISAWAQKNCAS